MKELDGENMPKTYEYEDFEDKTEDAEEVETEAVVDDGEYYPIPVGGTRLFSLVSVILAVLSVAVGEFLPYVGIALGVGAVVFSLISRKVNGYFDRPSVAGLIVGLIGAVFSIFALILVLTGVLEGLFIR